MGITINDMVAGSQRIAATNAGAVSLSQVTPTSGLTIGARQLFDGASLTQGSAPPQSLNRVTGTVLLSSQNVTTVYLSKLVAGIGSIQGGFILGIGIFSGSSYFDCCYGESSPGQTKSFNYSVV